MNASPFPNLIVCSYPKTGRTWLRFMLAHYLNDLSGVYRSITMQNMYNVVPNYETDEHGRGIDSANLPTGLPLMAMDHGLYDPALHSSTRIVFLIRDPRDVIVSHWYHAINHYGSRLDTLDKFVKDDRNGASAFFAHLESWANAISMLRDDIHITSYERLHADPGIELEKIVKHAHMHAQGGSLRCAVDAGKFNNMRQIELKFGMKGISYDLSNEHALRVRVGQIGSFRSELSHSSLRLINQLAEQTTVTALRILEEFTDFRLP